MPHTPRQASPKRIIWNPTKLWGSRKWWFWIGRRILKILIQTIPLLHSVVNDLPGVKIILADEFSSCLYFVIFSDIAKSQTSIVFLNKQKYTI